jgi:hypothetical protein
MSVPKKDIPKGLVRNVPEETTKVLYSPTINHDNWKHRSQGMRCRTCVSFVAKATSRTQSIAHLIGRCRRHAPSMNGWPVIFSDDWCGDHKLDEEKI